MIRHRLAAALVACALAATGQPAALAADPALRRPVPDLERLRAAPPISGMEGFLGFG